MFSIGMADEPGSINKWISWYLGFLTNSLIFVFVTRDALRLTRYALRLFRTLQAP
jgi:hypothetical protein